MTCQLYRDINHIPCRLENLFKNFTVKEYVHQINFKKFHPRRGGIILYTVKNGQLFFGVGLDAETHDLTDFGGGINYRHDRHPLDGVLREFHEETLFIFNNFTRDKLNSCLSLHDEKFILIFVHVDVDHEEVCHAYLKAHQTAVKSETCAITWLHVQEFMIALEQDRFFPLVSRLIKLNRDFISFL